ncbi:hypothetical protein [Persicobacter sp. CCB-QB2]|nr:hypothetical protein [Persicobacter sp. CCB-QB2]
MANHLGPFRTTIAPECGNALEALTGTLIWREGARHGQYLFIG